MINNKNSSLIFPAAIIATILSVVLIAVITIVYGLYELKKPIMEAHINMVSPHENNATGIANPASVYCSEQGGVLEIKTAKDGSQIGYCELPHGVTCEEWAFFRKECGALDEKQSMDDTCGDLTIGQAKEIAQNSECINEGTLKQKYYCDNDGDIWIELDVGELKGEMSGCKPACVIFSADKTAKINWRCTGLWGDQNKKVPAPISRVDSDDDERGFLASLISAAHAQQNDARIDPVSALLDKYHGILNSIKKTTYAHHYEVTDGMNESDGHYSTDCSGLGGYAINQGLPDYYYSPIEADRKQHDKANRPLASDFYRFFKKQDTSIDSYDQCWIKIEHMSDAQPGDMIISKYNHDKSCYSEGSTGHVMFIDSKPEPSKVHGYTQYSVYVIDSANDGHAHDTRDSGDYESYDCKHKDKPCGVGRGKIYFGANDNDEPIYYRWRDETANKGKWCICGDKDCDGEATNALQGIVIGRPVPCDKVAKQDQIIPVQDYPINNVIYNGPPINNVTENSDVPINNVTEGSGSIPQPPSPPAPINNVVPPPTMTAP